MMTMLDPRRLARVPLLGSRRSAFAAIKVGVVGLSDAAVLALDEALQRASAQASVNFVLHDGRGEVTLVDADLAADLTPEEWRTLFAGQPAVAAVARNRFLGELATPYRVSIDFDDVELLSTLNSIPEVRLRDAQLNAERLLDTAWLRAASPFTAELLRQWGHARAICLLAGYGEGCSVLVDFARGEVIADPRAWELLLAQRELPRLEDGDYKPSALTPRARVHTIESMLWAVGLASARLPLLGAPPAWRGAHLAAFGWMHLQQFSRVPVHLELAERIEREAVTPVQLRRSCRVDELELRAFLQAGLFLRLFDWVH